MRTRPNRGVLTNSPVLVGAVTVLVALVAVFLSYNANEGLPFVPTRTLRLELPDGANLTKGNEVRRGGYRVGLVTDISYQQVGVQTVAVATLKIDGKFARVPVDSHFSVRAKSALNHVPGESAMPFPWTINPYRGCSHSCVYCLAGDTQVLMADGRQRAIAQQAAYLPDEPTVPAVTQLIEEAG